MFLKDSKILPVQAFYGLILLLASLCMLMGCQEKSPKTTLQFSFWGSSEELQSIQNVIHQYEVTHPNIHIQAIHIPDNYFQKLHILIAADLTPDVMMLNSYYLPVYAEANKLLPIASLKHRNDFYSQPIQALSYKKIPYAFPRDISDLVVFVNLDLLHQQHILAPKSNWSMRDMLTISQKIIKQPTQQSNVYGISFSDKPLFWLPYVWSFGGSLKQLESPQSIAGLQFYADLVNKYHVAPSSKQIGTQGMSQLFTNRQLVFFVSGRWSVPFLRKTATFNWDALPFPRGPAGNIVGIDASGYAVSANSKNKQAALNFASYLTSTEALHSLTLTGLILPAQKKLAMSPAFIQKEKMPQHNNYFIQAIHKGQPTDVPSNWNEISEAMGLGLAPLWSGEKQAAEILPQLIPKLKKEYGDI